MPRGTPKYVPKVPVVKLGCTFSVHKKLQNLSQDNYGYTGHELVVLWFLIITGKLKKCPAFPTFSGNQMLLCHYDVPTVTR